MKRKREYEPFFSNKRLKTENNVDTTDIFNNKKRKYERDENLFNNKKLCLIDISLRNDIYENYTRYRRDILIYT